MHGSKYKCVVNFNGERQRNEITTEVSPKNTYGNLNKILMHEIEKKMNKR
jgi:hypothetical protein